MNTEGIDQMPEENQLEVSQLIGIDDQTTAAAASRNATQAAA